MDVVFGSFIRRAVWNRCAGKNENHLNQICHFEIFNDLNYQSKRNPLSLQSILFENTFIYEKNISVFPRVNSLHSDGV
jgi:hypothetical protein